MKDMEKRVEEIIKIICQYRTDNGDCTCNQHQFGVRKCDDPCAYRDIAEQVVDAGYAPVVHGEWLNRNGGNGTCSRCGIRQKAVYDDDSEQHYCGHCGAKMDGDSGMNLLEHYIITVHREHEVYLNPDFVNVDLTYDCYGTIKRCLKMFSKCDWEEAKKKGVFLA